MSKLAQRRGCLLEALKGDAPCRHVCMLLWCDPACQQTTYWTEWGGDNKVCEKAFFITPTSGTYLTMQ